MIEMKFATLVPRLYEKPFGGQCVHYEWEGLRNLPLRISRNDLREIVPSFSGGGWPTKIKLDGIPLQYLPGSENYSETFIWDAALYKRVDGLNWLGFTYWRVRRNLRRVFWFVYERSILTLHVWGLANYSPVCRPSWRDIKIFRLR